VASVRLSVLRAAGKPTEQDDGSLYGQMRTCSTHLAGMHAREWRMWAGRLLYACMGA